MNNPMNSNGVVAKIFGSYICVDCNKRFNIFGGEAIKTCPYCNHGNWYIYKEYVSMKRKGFIIK